jgi:hypothetical protein
MVPNWLRTNTELVLSLLLNNSHQKKMFFSRSCSNVFYLIFGLVIGRLGPSLWSSGQSFWLQIQRSGFDSRRYQIYWEVVGLERGPLSLVSTIEELLGRKSSGSALERREYGRRDPSSWPCGTLYPQKLALTSPTSGGRSISIVRWWSQATEFFLS